VRTGFFFQSPTYSTVPEHDLEQFEDDPLEFIRLDLSIPSTSGAGGSAGDVVTRRQAAADVLQALVFSGVEAETTEIVGSWISNGLQSYSANPKQNWKAKDSAIYLLGAIATKGSTTLVSHYTCNFDLSTRNHICQHGVTSTNALINVVDFFSSHIFHDLQAPSNSVHPMLQVDAIKFLYTFRNQVSFSA
jgi:exportin-2 (importin alpha re-exporter)